MDLRFHFKNDFDYCIGEAIGKIRRPQMGRVLTKQSGQHGPIGREQILCVGGSTAMRCADSRLHPRFPALLFGFGSHKCSNYVSPHMDSHGSHAYLLVHIAAKITKACPPSPLEALDAPVHPVPVSPSFALLPLERRPILGLVFILLNLRK